MAQSEQLVIERGAPRSLESPERAARASLKGQIGRLERECSAIVADAFPRISPADIPALEGWPAARRICAGVWTSVSRMSAARASCSSG